MPESDEVLREVYVQPGESCLVSEPAIIRTLLGSCVGVTFWVPRLGIGALCHAMLPS
jgi:chemotaxis protein CheD